MKRRPAALVGCSRVLYSLLVALLLSVGVRAEAQVNLTAEPAMSRGPVGAPVTIVEFSDYQ